MGAAPSRRKACCWEPAWELAALLPEPGDWSEEEYLALTIKRLAGLRVRLGPGKYREPDIAFLLAKHDKRRHEDFWEGAALVMEIVSTDPKDRRRDLVKKRREYTRPGMAEYWIVDPQEAKITVLQLAGKKYVVAGEYGRKDKAGSVLLKGFEGDDAAVLAAP